MRNFFGAGRKAMVAAGAAVFAFAVIAPTAGYLLSSDANANPGDSISGGPAGDPLEWLDGRSPGERLIGIATKQQRALGGEADPMGDGEGPQQRALGQVFDEPPPGEDLAFAPLSTPQSAALPESFLPLESTPGDGGGFGPGIGGNPGGGGGVPGGGSSGGGGGGGGGPPPVAPVPEPGTWALMILGFGAVGTAMRRRTRQQRMLPQV